MIKIDEIQKRLREAIAQSGIPQKEIAKPVINSYEEK